MSYDVRVIKEIEDAFEKIILECFNYGWTEDEIKIMFDNALERAQKKGEEP